MDSGNPVTTHSPHSPAHALDPRPMMRQMGLDETAVASPVHGGSDTAIWHIEHAGEIFAMRVFPPGSGSGCAREVAAMRAAGAAGIPVPRVVATSVFGDRPVLLLSWVPGRPLRQELATHPWRAQQLGDLFGRMHAAIHQVQAPVELCDPPDAWLAWAGTKASALDARLRAIPRPSPALLHLDYHPLNVMTDGSRITGVLDWANACGGDPRADDARTVSILRADLIGNDLSLLPERAVRWAFERGWRRGYERVAGTLGDLTLFYAWAGAMMERDLAAKRGPRERARIHRWAERWRRRAGLV